MTRIRLFLLIALSLMASHVALAQRFAVGTNALDWLSLGTLNAEASIAVSQHVSVHAGAELNPWTFRAGDKETQFEARQNSYWGGARWWPWHVYSGWWAGGDARYTVYNIGGMWKRDTEEGDAWGVGAYGGYSIMLNEWWNLDLGVGFAVRPLRLPPMRGKDRGRGQGLHPPGRPSGHTADLLSNSIVKCAYE